MASIAAVLIIKNEEKHLDECLSAINWCDEIIIVDAGSEDTSVEIARRYTDKVFIESDWQGFGIQRQRAQGHATTDWILMIDADERVTEQLKLKIQDIVKKNDQGIIYALPRLSRVFGKFIHHSGWYPDYVLRLYPRTKASYGDNRVHEKLTYDGSMTVKRLKQHLLHYTFDRLDQYLIKSGQYANEWAIQRHKQGKKTSLFNGTTHAIGCFVKMYFINAGFLDGKHGFLLAVLSAHSTFVKYAALWMYNQQVKKTGEDS